MNAAPSHSPRIHFVSEGRGPLVVLSHALGCNLSMWDEVADILKQRFTVLRYDHRGHGQSEAPAGPYSIDLLADDAAALIKSQTSEPVHFVGLSMGGMTAQSLAARYPALVRSITVANSAHYYNEAARAMWQARIATVLAHDVAAVADGAIQRWFTPEFRADAQGAARVAVIRQRLESVASAPYAASCAAVASMDFRASNPSIRCPTLVIAGTRDEATPVALSEAIVSSIPGATLATLDASHISAVEQPAGFAALLEDFFASQA
jgi:3-oxoadipate enol-lactonase